MAKATPKRHRAAPSTKHQSSALPERKAFDRLSQRQKSRVQKKQDRRGAHEEETLIQKAIRKTKAKAAKEKAREDERDREIEEEAVILKRANDRKARELFENIKASLPGPATDTMLERVGQRASDARKAKYSQRIKEDDKAHRVWLYNVLVNSIHDEKYLRKRARAINFRRSHKMLEESERGALFVPEIVWDKFNAIRLNERNEGHGGCDVQDHNMEQLAIDEASEEHENSDLEEDENSRLPPASPVSMTTT